jgi:hypothetical protein
VNYVINYTSVFRAMFFFYCTKERNDSSLSTRSSTNYHLLPPVSTFLPFFLLVFQCYPFLPPLVLSRSFFEDKCVRKFRILLPSSPFLPLPAHNPLSYPPRPRPPLTDIPPPAFPSSVSIVSTQLWLVPLTSTLQNIFAHFFLLKIQSISTVLRKINLK